MVFSHHTRHSRQMTLESLFELPIHAPHHCFVPTSKKSKTLALCALLHEPPSSRKWSFCVLQDIADLLLPEVILAGLVHASYLFGKGIRYSISVDGKHIMI